MRHTIPLVALLFVVACKKEEPAAPPATAPSPAPGTPTPAPAPAPAPAPTTPAPAPVTLTAEELKPTCAKIMTPELAAKTHGATEVKETGGQGRPMVVCELIKAGEAVGSATVACN